MSKYYTPELEEFHVGFRYEFLLDPYIYQTWNKVTCSQNKVIHHLFEDEPSSFRVKALDRDDIEELGWEYAGRTQDLQFTLVKVIQPFNLTYRSFRLQYSLEDHRLRIIGFEYDRFGPEEEVLFLGICNNYNELKFIMKRIGINE